MISDFVEACVQLPALIKRPKDTWINVLSPQSINLGIGSYRTKNVICFADGIQVNPQE